MLWRYVKAQAWVLLCGGLVGPIFLADLLSTEFMTEQRAQGDIVFSDQLMELYRKYPDLWNEIRQFFRRKETVMGLLLLGSKDTSR